MPVGRMLDTACESISTKQMLHSEGATPAIHCSRAVGTGSGTSDGGFLRPRLREASYTQSSRQEAAITEAGRLRQSLPGGITTANSRCLRARKASGSVHTLNIQGKLLLSSPLLKSIFYKLSD